MAKIICVLYDDPVDGYPKSYPRDDLPKVEHYPGSQTLPTPKAIDFKPGALLGSVSGEVDREHDHQIGGDHRELALGEIDDTGRPKDQDESQSDKSINGTDADTGEKQLEKEIHADRRAPRGMDPQVPAGACGGADQSVNSMCLSKTMVPLSLRTMLYPCRPSPNWSKLYSPSAPL
jgi:hypothetical protein